MNSSIPGPEDLASLVSRVTQTMFGMAFSLGSAGGTPWTEDPIWRAVILPITGGRPITVAIAADDRGGRVLGGQMFSCKPETVDLTMVDDSLAELANIVAGQVKSVMALDQTLGLPEVLAKDAGTRLAACGWKAATLTSGASQARVWVAVSEGKV